MTPNASPIDAFIAQFEACNLNDPVYEEIVRLVEICATITTTDPVEQQLLEQCRTDLAEVLAECEQDIAEQTYFESATNPHYSAILPAYQTRRRFSDPAKAAPKNAANATAEKKPPSFGAGTR